MKKLTNPIPFFLILLVALIIIPSAIAINYYELNFSKSVDCAGSAVGAGYARGQGIQAFNTTHKYISSIKMQIGTFSGTPATTQFKITNSSESKPNWNNPIYTQNFTVTASSWNTINFTTPYPLLNVGEQYYFVWYTGDATNKYYFCDAYNDYTNGQSGYVINANVATPTSWTLVSANDFSMNVTYADDIGSGSGTATISLTTGTTTAGIYYNETTNNITGVTGVTDYNPTNTTIYLYNRTSTTTYSNTTANFTATFTSLPVGNYTLNASSTNGTSTITATARNIIIYGTSTTISTPINKENITRSLNITYTDTITPTGTAYISTHNISILNNDGSLNFTVNSSTNTTPINYDMFNNNLTIGNYTLQIKTRDNYTYNRTFTKDFILTRDAELNVTLKYVIGNVTLGNYTLNITDSITGIKETYTTANNTTTIYIIKGRNYTITADKTGYAISNYTGVSFTNSYNNYTYYIYTENSVLITIYDESDLTIVNDSTVSITFSNNVSALSYITTNGTYYKDALTDGVWEVKFYSANYSYRTYFITVYNRSFQTLDAYLVPSAFTCVFTIRDSLTLAPLEDASFSVERLSNSSYIVVESKVSDIGGNVQIGFLPGIEYRFTLSKSGYTSKVFSLNPIIFNAYNIYLDKTASLNNTLDYGSVNIALYPKTFYNNRANGITFTITSPEGVLTNYRISIKAPGGSNSTTGSNAIGETFTLNFNITNATIFDRVNITYNYTSTMGGIKIYRFQYEIIGAGNVGNYTIANLKNREYGLGTFEKVLLVMVGMVIIVGFAFMLTGTAGALVIGLICLNVSVYLGFLPYWSVIIPDILGIIIIIAVSTGGRN